LKYCFLLVSSKSWYVGEDEEVKQNIKEDLKMEIRYHSRKKSDPIIDQRSL
jgi:hypothetical protein